MNIPDITAYGYKINNNHPQAASALSSWSTQRVRKVEKRKKAAGHILQGTIPSSQLTLIHEEKNGDPGHKNNNKEGGRWSLKVKNKEKEDDRTSLEKSGMPYPVCRPKGGLDIKSLTMTRGHPLPTALPCSR
jgi:hypothetical protein